MEISFILTEPSVPENIGSAARAIKTMGFYNLVLVNPACYPDKKAFIVAHGAREILEESKVVGTLEEALEGIDFAIATSAKKRSIRYDYHHIATLPEILEGRQRTARRVAVVFGREENGLTNGEIRLCDLISYIPMKQKYPSLNLSHAVMLYAYTLSPFARRKPRSSKNYIPGKYTVMKAMAEDTMEKIRFRQDSSTYHRIFERLALLKDADVNLVLSFLDKLDHRLGEKENS